MMFTGKAIDIFCGAGGFSVGAHMAGFTTALAIDSDKDLTASFPLNFPRVNLIHADLSGADFPALMERAGLKPGFLDVLLGGPPCQGFSTIGKREPDDERNRLIGQFFRFVTVAEPRAFVMENVPGLLATSASREVLRLGIEEVVSKYTIMGPLVLNSADFGAATNRSRVFVIGYDSGFVDPLTEADIYGSKTNPSTVYHAIHDLPSPAHAKADRFGQYWANYPMAPVDGPEGMYATTARLPAPDDLSTRELRQLHTRGIVSGLAPTNHSAPVMKRYAALASGKPDRVSKCPRLVWNAPSPALRAGTGKDKGSYQSIRPIHPSENRVITVREAARIQGFPDWFQFHRTKWHSFRMIGNSVSPYIACAILRLIASRIGIRDRERPSVQPNNSAKTG